MPHHYPDKVALLTNASASGAATTVDGGRYVWSSVGTFNGGTLSLQAQLPDSSTFLTIAQHTAASSTEIAVAGSSVMKVVVSGSPSGIYSTIQRVPQ